jgi:branched-chain amino acid transport protein azlD
MYSIILIAIMSLVTIVIRFLPFIIFSGKTTPKFINYLGDKLPYAIMGMLVIYCLKEVNLLEKPYGIHEITACVIVILVHIWKRNSLLSIGIGTLIYMLMV